MDLRQEKIQARLRLNIMQTLCDYGQVGEGRLRNRYAYYPPQLVETVVNQLCEEGFCERISTPQMAHVVVLKQNVERALRGEG